MFVKMLLVLDGAVCCDGWRCRRTWLWTSTLVRSWCLYRRRRWYREVQSRSSTPRCLEASECLYRSLLTRSVIGSLPSVLWHCWLGGRNGIRPV